MNFGYTLLRLLFYSDASRSVEVALEKVVEAEGPNNLWLVRDNPSPGDLGLVLGLGRSPGRRERQPTPVFLPGEFHGQRSLLGYSPWGHRE